MENNYKQYPNYEDYNGYIKSQISMSKKRKYMTYILGWEYWVLFC